MAIDWYTTGGGTDIVLALNYVAAFCNLLTGYLVLRYCRRRNA